MCASRVGHSSSQVRGLKAKLYNKKRYAEKAEMKKTIKQHAERMNKVCTRTPQRTRLTVSPHIWPCHRSTRRPKHLMTRTRFPRTC